MSEHALLLMGGIGDFLHYLTRLTAFLKAGRCGPTEPHVFVESLVPEQAEAVFTAALPDLSYTFLPPSIHWANTFPLLTPERESDRLNRPAYRYVESLGFRQITDWFLPFMCEEYEFDTAPLYRVIAGLPRSGHPYVVVSARDKGFLWWPDEWVCGEAHRLVTRSHRAVYVGTPNERMPGHAELETLPGVPDALALSYHADLYVGTDTGLATFRELTGKKNIYCVSRYWVEEVMARYGYFSHEMRRQSRSAFAFGREEFLALLAAEFRGREPARAVPSAPGRR